MLALHQSNQLETLADELEQVFRTPLSSPLAAETVVVQSRGVARWLSLRLAERAGISANIRFPFPNAYAWELYRLVQGDVPEQSAFEPEVLTWRISRLLPELEPLPIFAAVRHYVGNDALRRFELSARLARLYDEYLVYRPKWIAKWEAGDAPEWQGALWQRLAADAGTSHRATLHANVLQALKSSRAQKELPERIAVFGAPALPPELLRLFAHLSRHSDVHLFVQNPCAEYWGDIRKPGEIAQKTLAGQPEARYLDVGNSLLASLGRQGREFFDLLIEVGGEGVEERDAFVEPAGDGVLAAVQSDVLHLRERPCDWSSRPAHTEAPASIQIHSCYSAMREIEVLHDQLLALFQQHPDLEPADVVVITPDIEAYGPYIEAVFRPAKPFIPYNISDRSAEQESTLAATFFALTELPGSRYESTRLVGLLDEAAVRRRFGLSETDVETVRRWVRESRIRWGIDAAHRESFGLPGTHEHTWRFGLDRLVLGFALPAKGERLFDGILSYDEIEGSIGAVLGRFGAFAEAAIALHTQLAHPRPVDDWCETFHGLIARFFDAPDQRVDELAVMSAGIAALDRDVRRAQNSESVPLAVALAALRTYLEAPGRAFLLGGVTFCAMMPMRTLPFEVVCMVGMNDGAYPRMRRRESFDLMATDYQRGDRARRDDDRYLFLESLMSARRCLYISYTGRHIREDTVIPPSVLVSELLDYLGRGQSAEARSAMRKVLVTEHPLQAFSERYFTGDDPHLFTHSETLLSAAQTARDELRSTVPFIDAPLPPPDKAEYSTVSLETLLRFFRNPARAFLQERFGVRLETSEEELEATEPFALDPLTAFGLKDTLLHQRLQGAAEDGYALARAGGVLPHGHLGAAIFEQHDLLIERLAGEVERRRTERRPSLAFEHRWEHLTLVGALTDLTVNGLFDYRASKANANVRVSAWIRHLGLNAVAPKGIALNTCCVTADCVLSFHPVPDAKAQLDTLLELYWQGLSEPLHFFPRAALAYIEDERNIKAARSCWEGSNTEGGERENAYFSLALRGLDNALDARFEELAETIFGRMSEVLQQAPLQ